MQFNPTQSNVMQSNAIQLNPIQPNPWSNRPGRATLFLSTAVEWMSRSMEDSLIVQDCPKIVQDCPGLSSIIQDHSGWSRIVSDRQWFISIRSGGGWKWPNRSRFQRCHRTGYGHNSTLGWNHAVNSDDDGMTETSYLRLEKRKTEGKYPPAELDNH